MIWLDFETHLTPKKPRFLNLLCACGCLAVRECSVCSLLLLLLLSSQYPDYNPIGPAGSCSEGTGLRAPSAHPPQSRRATHPGRVKNKVGASSAWSARAGHAHSWPELVTLNGRHASHGPLTPYPPLPNRSYLTTPPRQGSNRAHANSNTHPNVTSPAAPACHFTDSTDRQTEEGLTLRFKNTQDLTEWLKRRV